MGGHAVILIVTEEISVLASTPFIFHVNTADCWNIFLRSLVQKYSLPSAKATNLRKKHQLRRLSIIAWRNNGISMRYKARIMHTFTDMTLFWRTCVTYRRKGINKPSVTTASCVNIEFGIVHCFLRKDAFRQKHRSGNELKEILKPRLFL